MRRRDILRQYGPSNRKQMDQVAQKEKKILVVEDERSLNSALQAALKHAGFTPNPAYDGEQALECLSKDTYDAVLLDLLLPKVSGFDVMATMSERHDFTPVIVITNLGKEETKKEIPNMGAIQYLMKSETTIADIIKHVQNLINAGHAQNA